MWDIVGKQNTMNRKWEKPTIEDTSEFLVKMLKKIDSDKQKFLKDRFYELKFEDLEKNPAKEIKSIYKHLNVQFSEEFKKQISDFLFR